MAARVFKLWSGQEGDERDALLRDVLLDRGWIDGGDLGPRECYPAQRPRELPAARDRAQPGPRPAVQPDVRRAAARVLGVRRRLGCRQLRHLPGISTPQAEWHGSRLPGAEPACYKTSTAKCLRGFDFVPETYLVPQEAAALVAAGGGKGGGKGHWVGKPRNEYAAAALTFAGAAAQGRRATRHRRGQR